MSTLLITGANRGIGLEFVRQYAEEGWRVLATCREPQNAGELGLLAAPFPEQVEVFPLSVTDPEQILALASRLEGRPIDLLVNNAGVRRMDAYHLGEIQQEAFLDSMNVNAFGALKVAEAFLPHLALADAPLLVMMSSALGSISKNEDGGDYSYRASKAAMNAVMRSLAVDLRDMGITVISLHPGWVRTEMGGEEAPLSTGESVSAIRRVLQSVGLRDSGRFLRFDGTEEPW